VTRAPQELSLEDALAAYTINSAYSLRQGDKEGSVEVGNKGRMQCIAVRNLNMSKKWANKCDLVPNTRANT